METQLTDMNHFHFLKFQRISLKWSSISVVFFSKSLEIYRFCQKCNLIDINFSNFSKSVEIYRFCQKCYLIDINFSNFSKSLEIYRFCQKYNLIDINQMNCQYCIIFVHLLFILYQLIDIK